MRPCALDTRAPEKMGYAALRRSSGVAGGLRKKIHNSQLLFSFITIVIISIYFSDTVFYISQQYFIFATNSNAQNKFYFL